MLAHRHITAQCLLTCCPTNRNRRMRLLIAPRPISHDLPPGHWVPRTSWSCGCWKFTLRHSAVSWVVSKNMVPFWIPITIRHLIFRVLRRDRHFDNHPHEFSELSAGKTLSVYRLKSSATLQGERLRLLHSRTHLCRPEHCCMHKSGIRNHGLKLRTR